MGHPRESSIPIAVSGGAPWYKSRVSRPPCVQAHSTVLDTRRITAFRDVGQRPSSVLPAKTLALVGVSSRRVRSSCGAETCAERCYSLGCASVSRLLPQMPSCAPSAYRNTDRRRRTSAQTHRPSPRSLPGPGTSCYATFAIRPCAMVTVANHTRRVGEGPTTQNVPSGRNSAPNTDVSQYRSSYPTASLRAFFVGYKAASMTPAPVLAGGQQTSDIRTGRG